jgi:foldase protein PrsA
MSTPRRTVTRTARLLTAAGAALLLLSGCGDGEVQAGAAAIVGDERITTDELRELVERGLSDPQAAQQLGGDRAGFQRQALSRLINAEVLERAAEQAGVEVTPGDVDEQIGEFAEQAGSREALEQQAAQSGVAPADLRDFVRSIVLDRALGDELTEDVEVPREDLEALYQQNIAQYDQVRTRHILVEQEAVARDVLAQVTADRSRFAALAAELSIDTSNADNGGDLGLNGRGAFVPEFENAVFGAAEGELVIVQTQFGWHVVEVQEKVQTSLAEAEEELRRGALEQQRQELVQEAVREAAAELDITVNPRFGAWDPETLSVVPVEDPNGVFAPESGAPEAPTGELPLPDGEQAPEGEPAPSPAG